MNDPLEAKYVTRSATHGLLELRQVRYRSLLRAGQPHPRDLIVVAHSLVEMREIVSRYEYGLVDYSEVEPKESYDQEKG